MAKADLKTKATEVSVAEFITRLADERQRVGGRIAPGDPRDDVRPVLLARHQLGLDAVALQVVVQILRTQGLVAQAGLARVGGVAADQRLGDLDHLVVQRRPLAHAVTPIRSRIQA